MALRLARSQGIISLAVIVFLGWITLHDYTFNDYPALRYPFGEYREEIPSPPPVIEDPSLAKQEPQLELQPEPEPEPAPAPVNPSQDLGLPEFCDYCGPKDQLCLKYGYVPSNHILQIPTSYPGNPTSLEHSLSKVPMHVLNVSFAKLCVARKSRLASLEVPSLQDTV